MPYIAQSKRDLLEQPIEAVRDALRQLESDGPENNFEGNMNYIISTLIDRCYKVSYRDINDVVGMLDCVKQEYYRRVAIPYENQKIHDNGDVYSK